MSYYTATFVSISKTGNVFWNISRLGSTYWLQSIRKSDTRNFCLFVYLQVTTTKVNFCFWKHCSQAQQVLFENQLLLRKMLVSFFSSNIPLYIRKNPVEKLRKVLEFERKTYTPVGLKFIFEKIKFNVLHYIQHDFIHQRQGSVKIRLACSKPLLLTISSSNIVTHSNGFIKGDKHFFLKKVGVANVLLKLYYLQSRVETQYRQMIYFTPNNIKHFIERSRVTY